MEKRVSVRRWGRREPVGSRAALHPARLLDERSGAVVRPDADGLPRDIRHSPNLAVDGLASRLHRTNSTLLSRNLRNDVVGNRRRIWAVHRAVKALKRLTEPLNQPRMRNTMHRNLLESGVRVAGG